MIRADRASLRQLVRDELERRAEIKARCEASLVEFIAHLWHVVEPEREFVRGWAIDGLCEHLTAVTDGHIKRLLLGVPPGFLKSLSSSVFWPAWEWGPRNMPSMRYLAASYSQGLTVRDNGKFLQVIRSPEFQKLWGDRFEVTRDTVTKPENNKSGWKLASSVGGVGTGERGDRVIADDPNSIKSVESDVVRNETNRWFTEVVPTRINDPEESAIVVIQQRTHESDVTGTILSKEMDYVYYMVPMEYDSARRCVTVLAVDEDGEPTRTWEDPRSEDGDLAFPERFTSSVVAKLKNDIGEYAAAAQLQQLPAPRGGGIFKRKWWGLYPPLDHPERDSGGRIVYPPFEYLVASLDTALTEKQENDPSALTIWGVWRDTGVKKLGPRLITDGNQLVRLDDDQRSKIMLVYGWKKHLELHGPPVPDEAQIATTYCHLCQAVTGMKHADTCREWLREQQKFWGIVEWTVHACRNYRIDTLLIEAKANGLDVASELRRLYANEDWGVELITPKGDKVARAHSVVHLYSNGIIFAPQLFIAKEDRWAYPAWAETVISDMAIFPRGGRDITDTATQALQHLRDRGLAVRNDEQDAAYEESFRVPQRLRPLYPT
jgi:hypothetical protein